jgi:hypothetical protein
MKVKDKFAKGTEKFSRKIYNIIEIDKLSFILKNSKGVILKQKYKIWPLKKVTTVESPEHREDKLEDPIKEPLGVTGSDYGQHWLSAPGGTNDR